MNKKGFTLIELGIVLAIIMILIAIAAPAFITRSEKSDEIEVMTQEQEAQEMVVDENIQPVQPEKKESGGFIPL